MLDLAREEKPSDIVRDNLRREIEVRGITATELARRLPGNSVNKVTRFLSGRGGIGLETYMHIERSLGLAPGVLMSAQPVATVRDINVLLGQVAANRSGGPTAEDFIRWSGQNGGVVSPDDPFLEHIDAYGAPHDRGMLVNPLRIGRNSPLSKKFDGRSPQETMAMLSESDMQFCHESATAHMRVLEGASILDQRQINEVFGGKISVTGTYVRVLQPGIWEGAPAVLAFVREV